MLTSDFGLELLLITALATLLGIALNSFIRNQSERARKALHQHRIECFLNTANEIEEATHRLTQEIPAETMAEILQMASIADLFAIQTAISKAKAATQQLETTHLKQINAIAQGIGLTNDTKSQKQLTDHNGGKAAQTNQTNQTNGGNLDKTGKRLIGELRGRLQSNGKSIEFNELSTILREQHNITTASEFAALSDDQRQAIEATF